MGAATQQIEALIPATWVVCPIPCECRRTDPAAVEPRRQQYPPASEAERRDVRAREARDRLAELLNIEPGQLRRITADEAEAMVAEIRAERRRTGRE
jgi:hypothetical protein